MSHAAGARLVAEGSHQCELMAIATHLVNSPQVTLRNWFSLLALTMTDEPILVDSIHRMSQLTSADLPIPRPEATALRMAWSTALGSLLARTCLAISRSTSRCQARGPLKCSSGVSFCPQGKTNMTNASGSLASMGDQS